jgi:hypothetical protein
MHFSVNLKKSDVLFEQPIWLVHWQGGKRWWLPSTKFHDNVKTRAHVQETIIIYICLIHIVFSNYNLSLKLL